MSREELKHMAYASGLVNDLCTEKDVDYAFNLSKESIVDELSNENIIRLQFVEFLEAFARIADKSSFPRFTMVGEWKFRDNKRDKSGKLLRIT